MSLVGLPTGSAQAFDYVDGQEFGTEIIIAIREPNHQKEVVQNPGKPAVKIIKDTVKFVPINEPATREAAKE